MLIQNCYRIRATKHYKINTNNENCLRATITITLNWNDLNTIALLRNNVLCNDPAVSLVSR